MAKHVYWVGLLLVVTKACRYWQKWKNKIPTELRSEIGTYLDALDIVCAALIEWDNQHAQGLKGDSPSS